MASRRWLSVGLLVLAMLAGCGGGGTDVGAAAGSTAAGTGTGGAATGTGTGGTSVGANAAGTSTGASAGSTAGAAGTSGVAAGVSPAASSPAPAVPSAYDLAVDAAEAKRREVETLAVAGPCDTDDQCGALMLDSTSVAPMVFPDELDYSLVSPTAAAAGKAVAEYNELALRARELAPPDNSICACISTNQLTSLRCVARKCVRVHGLVSEEIRLLNSIVQSSRAAY